jgi:DNA-binding LacI/PurR family transcriptional regulator
MEAARLLLRRLGGDRSPAQQLRLPSELVVRRSSRRTPRDPPVAYQRSMAAP